MRRDRNINKGFIGIITSIILCIIIFVFIVIYFEKEKKEKLLNYFDCEPYSINIERVNEDYVDIFWKTKEKCTGYIKYGNDYSDLDYSAYPKGNSISTEKNVQIKYEVQPTFFTIVSGNEEYGIDSFPIEISDLF